LETEVKALFDRYEQSMKQALAGKPDLEEATAFYAPGFVAASPAGIMAGKNDDALKKTMEQGYAHYRAIGTKEMRIRNVRISPIDAYHCMAHVAWTATYARKDQPDIAIDFEVHYLVQQLHGAPKIFGWISGDEQEVLKQHGIG
jgi:hypothetical protein